MPNSPSRATGSLTRSALVHACVARLSPVGLSGVGECAPLRGGGRSLRRTGYMVSHARPAGSILPVSGGFRKEWRLALSKACHNQAIDTDPQQQAAASPLVLVVRSFLR